MLVFALTRRKPSMWWEEKRERVVFFRDPFVRPRRGLVSLEETMQRLRWYGASSTGCWCIISRKEIYFISIYLYASACVPTFYIVHFAFLPVYLLQLVISSLSLVDASLRRQPPLQKFAPMKYSPRDTLTSSSSVPLTCCAGASIFILCDLCMSRWYSSSPLRRARLLFEI